MEVRIFSTLGVDNCEVLEGEAALLEAASTISNLTSPFPLIADSQLLDQILSVVDCISSLPTISAFVPRDLTRAAAHVSYGMGVLASNFLWDQSLVSSLNMAHAEDGEGMRWSKISHNLQQQLGSQFSAGYFAVGGGMDPHCIKVPVTSPSSHPTIPPCDIVVGAVKGSGAELMGGSLALPFVLVQGLDLDPQRMYQLGYTMFAQDSYQYVSRLNNRYTPSSPVVVFSLMQVEGVPAGGTGASPDNGNPIPELIPLPFNGDHDNI